MAGLLAARVLADAFADVLVIDRDPLTGAGGARRGLAQARHAHSLLGRGQQILEELFPGFSQDAAAAGIPTADVGALRWYFNGQRLAPASTGLLCLSAGRPVLDSQVLARVRALPNVRLAERTEVLGLIADEDNSRVTGVRVRCDEAGGEEVIAADLVIDATGRDSRTPHWLAELGYDSPQQDLIPLDLTYVTRHFRLPDEEILEGAQSIHLVAAPEHTRGAVLARVEDGRCVVTLTGLYGDRPPTDVEGFLEWTRTLPAPDVYQVIRDAQPLDEAVSDTFAAGQRRRYEQVGRLPERLLVIGDAACSLNPVHSQGMTVAAQQALALREHLQHGIPQPLVFQKEVSGVLDVPWSTSVNGDLSFSGAQGGRAEDLDVSAAFTARLQHAATGDPVLARALLRIAHLVDSPETLMTTDIVTRALGPAPQPMT
jgi:2-polyprenyl-6-methoxyphenol hydroxylase-like FAD-dependent oxidoreductase